ncbi:hypothetical protein SESBI_43340 [Sesbania bispinosa]|nr:hypothetical protein SESBI_43340 [Sesbania bispinosa]
MEDTIYRLNLNPPLLEDLVIRDRDRDSNVNVSASSESHPGNNNYLHFHEPGSDRMLKNQIASHPIYPNLLSAYIECQKVGAPSELVSLLEEIARENHPTDTITLRQNIGDDPELDDFMESYCEILHRYKEELSKPFNEATLFLCNIQSQLTDLCKGKGKGTLLTISSSDIHNNHRSDHEVGGTSEDELSCGKGEAVEGHESCGTGDQELKEMLLRKYGGYLSSLRKEFLKKRKKGKLPKDARKTLMDWWNTHYRWPYPTEEEKLQLSEMTGLDQKQINNWFINQRKRHWKPSESAIMEGVSGSGIGGPL